METIKTVYENQADILKGIMRLNGVDRFDVDMSYGNGGFYKDIPPPQYRFDIDPEIPDAIEACSTDLSAYLPRQSVSSAIFDPPFLTYVRENRTGNGGMILARRFSGYWSYDDLSMHYVKTTMEAARILKKGGVFVVKCQDIVHNHRLQSTHINMVRWASDFFTHKDTYILPAKNRMPSPNRRGKQKHARIYHSYFLVFERKT